MTPLRPAPVDRPRSSGFVLVGVVMFVLALTILGISLFGLSSYEAQFYGRSSDKAQAFYTATGGEEWAKFVLISVGTLQSVRDAVTAGQAPSDVVYVRARYRDDPADSSSAIAWQSHLPIELRVLAVHNGERCMIERTFTPNSPNDFYKRLVTASDRLELTGLPDRPPQAFVTGNVWQNSTDVSSWSTAGSPPTLWKTGGLQIPGVASFIAAPHAGLLPISASHEADVDYTYDLTGGPAGQPHFYSTPAGGASHSLWHHGGNPIIRVAGHVVWMFDKGVTFDDELTVQGTTPDDCLILVAGTGTFGTYVDAAGLEGSITSPTVPVVIVTDGRVEIEHFNNNVSGASGAGYLSIYSQYVSLRGPSFVPGIRLQMTHVPNDARDLPGGLIDRLYAEGALPDSPGSIARLAVTPGSWRQVADSYPN